LAFAAATEQFFFWATSYLLAALAAATALSKRLSPRKSSQHGFKRSSPYVGNPGDPGIVATFSSCSNAPEVPAQAIPSPVITVIEQRVDEPTKAQN